ncbi:hypothetical protein PMZ80_006063 [Knufia obscura]|uniref:Uncharacterized protein n=2 Tax=Knufia TaxID=430999 RepID=A0AAN8F1H4_9EURO|nr:hypothetical protein PMZ80_006063 [Knufia obscura]KAK5954733.1 hypothetical protein OHC33_004457 [Knufia fluminis]
MSSSQPPSTSASIKPESGPIGADAKAATQGAKPMSSEHGQDSTSPEDLGKFLQILLGDTCAQFLGHQLARSSSLTHLSHKEQQHIVQTILKVLPENGSPSQTATPQSFHNTASSSIPTPDISASRPSTSSTPASESPSPSTTSSPRPEAPQRAPKRARVHYDEPNVSSPKRARTDYDGPNYSSHKRSRVASESNSASNPTPTDRGTPNTTPEQQSKATPFSPSPVLGKRSIDEMTSDGSDKEESPRKVKLPKTRALPKKHVSAKPLLLPMKEAMAKVLLPATKMIRRRQAREAQRLAVEKRFSVKRNKYVLKHKMFDEHGEWLANQEPFDDYRVLESSKRDLLCEAIAKLECKGGKLMFDTNLVGLSYAKDLKAEGGIANTGAATNAGDKSDVSPVEAQQEPEHCKPESVAQSKPEPNPSGYFCKEDAEAESFTGDSKKIPEQSEFGPPARAVSISESQDDIQMDEVEEQPLTPNSSAPSSPQSQSSSSSRSNTGYLTDNTEMSDLEEKTRLYSGVGEQSANNGERKTPNSLSDADRMVTQPEGAAEQPTQIARDEVMEDVPEEGETMDYEPSTTTQVSTPAPNGSFPPPSLPVSNENSNQNPQSLSSNPNNPLPPVHGSPVSNDGATPKASDTTTPEHDRFADFQAYLRSARIRLRDDSDSYPYGNRKLVDTTVPGVDKAMDHLIRLLPHYVPERFRSLVTNLVQQCHGVYRDPEYTRTMSQGPRIVENIKDGLLISPNWRLPSRPIPNMSAQHSSAACKKFYNELWELYNSDDGPQKWKEFLSVCFQHGFHPKDMFLLNDSGSYWASEVLEEATKEPMQDNVVLDDLFARDTLGLDVEVFDGILNPSSEAQTLFNKLKDTGMVHQLRMVLSNTFSPEDCMDDAQDFHDAMFQAAICWSDNHTFLKSFFRWAKEMRSDIDINNRDDMTEHEWDEFTWVVRKLEELIAFRYPRSNKFGVLSPLKPAMGSATVDTDESDDSDNSDSDDDDDSASDHDDGDEKERSNSDHGCAPKSSKGAIWGDRESKGSLAIPGFNPS